MAVAYDVGLDVRHALARRVILACMILYSDGPLTSDDVARITDAVDVLTALLNRSDKCKLAASHPA
jgi:hypothetical protein